MHHLSGVCATLSWLWLSPSHRYGIIECDIVSVTALTFLPCHLSQLPTPTGGLWSQWPPCCGATGQSWPSSSTSQKSLHLWLECVFTLTWWWPGHCPICPGDSVWFFSVELLSSCCPYSAYRILLLFFQYLFKVVYPDTSPVSEQEKQSPEPVSKSESPMFPLDEPESEDVQPLVLFELPVTIPLSGLVRALVGPRRGLEDSCLHCPQLDGSSL